MQGTGKFQKGGCQYEGGHTGRKNTEKIKGNSKWERKKAGKKEHSHPWVLTLEA